MLLILNTDDFKEKSIYFGEKSNNTIIDNSFFHNIIYITPLLSIQQLYINFELKNVILDEYYNKYKITMNDLNVNAYVLKKLIYIESSILYRFNKNKDYNFKLKTQINTNSLKCMTNINVNKRKIYKSLKLLIKISGIWEKINEIGLIAKLIVIQ